MSAKPEVIRFLKKAAHALGPVVMIGKQGLDDGILAKLETELRIHELVKIRILDSETAPVRETAMALASAGKALLVDCIGKTIVLYRDNPELTNNIPIRACGLDLERGLVRKLAKQHKQD